MVYIDSPDFEYLRQEDIEKLCYAPLYEALVKHEIYKDVELGAKTLYSLFLRRAALSKMNGAQYLDDNGNVYIIYTIEQIMKDTWISSKTATKYLNQLESVNLIKRKRRGQGKASLIYVGDFEVQFLKRKKYNSKSVKFTTQETEKVQCSKKDFSNKDFSNKDFSNIHSLPQQAAQPQFPAMPEQEGMSEIDSIEEIEDEICRLKALPYTYKSNPQRMEAAIHYMTEWNTLFPAGFNDDLRQRVYNLFNEALIEMCCADKPMTLKGSYVTYAKVIDKLNQLAEFGDYYVDLSEFSEPAMDNFIRGAEGDEIRNPLAYMKSCIWDAMQTGNVNLYADLRRSGF